ncbi:hypothetical protein AD006_09760 [Pseudonocardia sp. EC080610-09]|nr:MULTISPECIES: helix-turn-helix transcriptional regulator [unclassified Pseudonocardia]ALE72240.1 hypothetical protein FRP1_02140 [Pseudonocardia sp. EC080625-04]ALL75523.1 hypothetical protein AD006_09760 [Pseudonocardia sp. EC080610-09]ALL82550.1 hypothetical protein AD017_17590 [Pseudonocardia sp. EC080619-01]
MRVSRRRLAVRRRSIGLTQEGLAEALGVDRSTIGRWESGATAPHPSQRRRLSAVLGVSSSELSTLLLDDATDLGPGHIHDGTDTVAAPVPVGDGSAQFLIRTDGSTHLGRREPSDPRHACDEASVSCFRHQVQLCKTVDGRAGASAALPAVVQILGALGRCASEADHDVRRTLACLSAEAAEFAAWMYRDARNPTAAGFWLDRAVQWSQEAGDLEMQGYLLLKRSQMAYEERDGGRVLALAQAADRGPWPVPWRVKAEILQQEARGMAMTGSALADVERKMGEAQEIIDGNTDAPRGDPRFGSYYDAGTHLLRSASCYLEAGKPARAASLFGEVLGADTLTPRDEGYFRARRSVALALSGEPDAAAEEGVRAVQRATETGSGRTRRELARAVTALGPWLTRPRPRELRDALMASRSTADRP